MSILWRPNLFSTVGAAFYQDQTNTLEDGNHFRWHLDPCVGFPYETEVGPVGGFFILKLNDRFPCLAKLDLEKYAGTYPYVRSLTNKIDSDLFTEDDGFSFVRQSHSKSNLAAQRMRNLLRVISIYEQTPSAKLTKYLTYWNTVLDKFESDYLEFNPRYEKAEVCGVQMTFRRGEGTTPGNSDGSSNNGCIGSIIGLFRERRYAVVKAIDKEGNVLAEDWIGRRRYSASSMLSRAKRRIKFTAVGIAKIVIEPLPGQPVYVRDQVAWVNCEDYCNAPVWDIVVDEAIRFDPRETSHAPHIHRDKYYSPFKKTFDWNQVDTLWKANVINNPDVTSLFEIHRKKNTHDLYYHTTTLADSDPSDEGFSEINIPLLPTLLQGAMDTALASLFGLYRRVTNSLQGRDVMVASIPPFFEADNLAMLRTLLGEIEPELDVPTLDPFFENFLFDKSNQGPNNNYDPMVNLLAAINGKNDHSVYGLGGLVLCEHTEQLPKEAPRTPQAFNTTVGAIDLPDNEDSDEIKLFVDSLLNIPNHPFTRHPYEKVFTYGVERKIAGGSFENAASDAIIDPLEDIGILPAVFTLNREKSPNLNQLRDNFKLDVPPEDQVQYRIQGYDIFCRPTDWVTGTVENIPIPCHPPTAPTNLSSQVIVEDGKVIAEVVVSVDGTSEAFQATPDLLEFAVHDLDVSAPGEVDTIQWSGNKVARGVTINYDSSIHYPDTNTAVINCKSLTWAGDQLNWSDAGTSCDSIYPGTPFEFVIFSTSTMVEAETNFRTFKLRIGLGSVSDLGPGDHRWCARIRISGNCDGTLKHSKESCASIRHKIVAPPPPVVQLPVSIIPESTSPDKLGNSYYNLDVAPFIPTPVAGSPSMVNIYRIDLESLTDDISTMVSDNLLLGGQMPQLLSLAKKSQMRYEKINESPVEINASPTFHKIKVPGTMESYHVIGVVGCNPEREENAWENASIILFKTPKPVAVPKLRCQAVTIEKDATGSLAGNIVYKADFETEVTAPIPAPKIVAFRKDYHTGQSAFVGEASGVWNAAESSYVFSISDTTPQPWRKYSYEANLLIGAEKHSGKFVKSKEKARGDALAPGLSTHIPLDATFTASINPTASGFELSSEFLIGDFTLSISKINEDLETTRVTGKIVNGVLSGLHDAGTLTVLSSGNYQLVWSDNDPTAGIYTLRISRGQQLPWSIKLKTHE